jgi:hypothetical protein
VHKAAWLKADKSFAERVKAHIQQPLCALLNALIAGNADEKAQAALWGRMWRLPVGYIFHHATPRQALFLWCRWPYYVFTIPKSQRCVKNLFETEIHG